MGDVDLSSVIGRARAATVSGGYATATGSADAATTVTTLAQLQAAVSAGRHHLVVSGTINGGAKPVTITFASTSWNNTTIEPPTGNNAAGYAQGQYNANQIGSGGVIFSESNSFYRTNQTNQVGLDDTTHASYQFYERSNV